MTCVIYRIFVALLWAAGAVLTAGVMGWANFALAGTAVLVLGQTAPPKRALIKTYHR